VLGLTSTNEDVGELDKSITAYKEALLKKQKIQVSIAFIFFETIFYSK